MGHLTDKISKGLHIGRQKFVPAGRNLVSVEMGIGPDLPDAGKVFESTPDFRLFIAFYGLPGKGGDDSRITAVRPF